MMTTRKRNETLTTREATAYLVKRLKEKGFNVMGYKSKTSESYYLKLDRGVCNSIRISDHKGKKHLKYRYNISTRHKKIMAHQHGGFDRVYYPARIWAIDRMIEDAEDARRKKIDTYGNHSYQRFQSKAIADNAWRTKGFWAHAKEL